MSDVTRSRVVTEPLGGSPLSVAIQTRRLPQDLQPWRPATEADWKEHANLVRGSMRDGWYESLSPALQSTGLAAQRLERVVSEGGIVVTTGQQAALFGGPLYTVAKALTALGLADTIEQQLGIPVAPVFWAATDDADFLEASRTYVADAEGLHELTLEAKPPAGTPMSLAPFGDVSALLDRLRRACGSAAHADYFELARVAFTEAGTIGSAYVRMLRELLAPLGISVLDSSHPAYHEAARPILLDALQRAPQVAKVAAQRTAAIKALGFDPQVDDERGLSLVAIIENGVKRRVPVDEAPTLLKTGVKNASLAPNVLLRPVVEREILPTVAYVAGPAELAYFAQSSAVAAALGRTPPVGVPRWSCTVIEPFAEKALKRLGAEYQQLRDVAALERKLATAAVPPKVAAAWKTLQEQVQTGVRQLGSAVRDASLMPPEVIEGVERSLQHKLNRAERRLLAAVKRREERVRRDLGTASAALFPLGQRQERMLNWVPMLTRGGPDLVDDMRRAALTHAASLVGERRPASVSAR